MGLWNTFGLESLWFILTKKQIHDNEHVIWLRLVSAVCHTIRGETFKVYCRRCIFDTWTHTWLKHLDCVVKWRLLTVCVIVQVSLSLSFSLSLSLSLSQRSIEIVFQHCDSNRLWIIYGSILVLLNNTIHLNHDKTNFWISDRKNCSPVIFRNSIQQFDAKFLKSYIHWQSFGLIRKYRRKRPWASIRWAQQQWETYFF